MAGHAQVTVWRHYATSRHGQVHFLSGAPVDPDGLLKTPLICLHQSPMSGDVFEDFIPVMATDPMVHCPDTPGFGASDRPQVKTNGGKPTIADFGGGIADAVADLGYGAGNQVDLFGFHTGSMVATELTRARPHMVRRVILIGLPYYPAEQRPEMERQFVTPYAFFTDPDYVPDMYRRMVLEADNTLSKEQRLANFTGRMRAGPHGQDGPDAVWSYDADEGLAALAALGKPTLFLNYNEVLAEPHRHARRLFFPNAPLVELMHLPMMGFHADYAPTGPDDTAAAIRPFLDG